MVATLGTDCRLAAAAALSAPSRTLSFLLLAFLFFISRLNYDYIDIVFVCAVCSQLAAAVLAALSAPRIQLGGNLCIRLLLLLLLLSSIILSLHCQLQGRELC